MQASQANNETRLPRAVLKVSEAIKAHIESRNEPRTDPADPTAPPALPSAEAAPPADPNPPADPRAADPAYWKQRFEVTAGVLKAERDGRKTDAQAFQQRISELGEQVRSLQTAPQPSGATIDLGQFFTPDQVKLLGEDEATAIAKAALGTAQKAVKDAIDAEIKPLKDAAKNAADQHALDRKTAFQDKLTEVAPNWAAIDKEEAWLIWLAEENESGVERQTLLDAHVKKGDAVKVGAMFNAFLKSKELPAPPMTPNGTGAGTGGEPSPRPNPTGLGKPTAAEIKAFYTKAALGKVKDQERATFEARMKL